MREMAKMTKIFVTKYALSEGPFSVMAELKYEGRSAFWRADGNNDSAYGEGFWMTKEDALKDCERRREAKLASISKQAKKLQAMTFTIKDRSDE